MMTQDKASYKVEEVAVTAFTMFSESQKHRVSLAPGVRLPVDDRFIELSVCRTLALFL